MNLRFRPLLDGPLFGAFGSYAMDGTRTPRSETAATIARWANAPEQAPLFAANPVRGDIGILVVPEVQQFDYLLSHEGKFDTYSSAMWGAYRGFFDNGIQADWVHIDDIEAYDLLYFPYPIMFTAAQATRIADWVGAGGILIAEACPGYFGDRGRVGTVQPNMGLDTVFGAREVDVEFMPDIGDRIRFTFAGLGLAGGGFLQSYSLAGGTPRGDFDDGRLAVVEHRFGKGRTLLIGTHPSVGYYRTGAESGRRYFAECLNWAGKIPLLRSDNPHVQVRAHRGEGRIFLWFVNPTRKVQRGRLEVTESPATGRPGTTHWASEGAAFDGEHFTLPPRDALVVELRLP